MKDRKETLLLHVSESQMKIHTDRLNSLLEDVNKLYKVGKAFGDKPETQIHLITDWVDEQLRSEFSPRVIPSKAAFLVGSEKQYNLVNDLWSMIKINPTYKKYSSLLRYNEGLYYWDKEVFEIIEKLCEVYLRGADRIEVYEETQKLVDQFLYIMKLIGNDGELGMGDRNKFAASTPLLSCGIDWVLRPSVSRIKDLIR